MRTKISSPISGVKSIVGTTSMGKLTATRHGDAANDLLAFYREKVHELQESGEYFMAAMLVEFGEENGANSGFSTG
jgi:hypothetical protein